MKHIVTFLISSIVYMLSFHITALDFMHIYFYDGIIRLLLVFILMLVVLIICRKILFKDYKDICLALAIFGLANMLWLSLCVVSLDRSLSVYMLCYMDSSQSQLDADSFKEHCKEQFVNEYEMIDRRYEEQIASKNIEIDENNQIHMTPSGKRMVKIFRVVGRLYHTDDRFTNP